MSSRYDPEIAARKAKNREVYQEAMEICKRGWYEAPSGKRAVLPSPGKMPVSGKKGNEKISATIDRGRAKGMLWGLVVGDAFGSPIQFSGRDSHPWITEMVACPVFGLPPGYWTDDSSMAMCVMDSYVRKGGYDLKDIAGTFVKWLKEGYLSSIDGRAFDVGCATRDSVSAFARTGSLANGVESSQGNGSIMRFAPSYLIARSLGRDEVIHEVSDVTHAYPDRTIHLTLIDCEPAPGAEPTALEHDALGWFTPEKMASLDFCPADAELLPVVFP